MDFDWFAEYENRDLICAPDGFRMLRKSLALILLDHGIAHLPGSSGEPLACDRYFDDWYLYAIGSGQETIYGLVKMREQEAEHCWGIPADGDTPGVTVSFLEFHTAALTDCIENPGEAQRAALAGEIDRVCAARRQVHHSALKAYFLRPEAQGSYVLAQCYTEFLASFAKEGSLPLPQALLNRQNRNNRRILAFLDRNNASAGYTVCDGQRIYLKDPGKLNRWERQALLAAHTGNLSAHSFAAEIRFHAMFLSPLVRFRLPVFGNPYESAIRADLSVADREFAGPQPYYRENGLLIRQQRMAHPDWAW